MAGVSPAMLPAAAALPAMAPMIDLLECLADVFVGGVLYTRLAWVMGFDLPVVRVRAGAEVRCFPSACCCVIQKV
jgi:hypothetical protein